MTRTVHNDAADAAHALRVQWMLAGAMLLWGVNISAVKVLTTFFDVMLVASLRMVVACCAFTAMALHRRRLPALRARHIGAVLVAGALMVYANQILFAAGLARSSATNGALIMSLSPLVSSLLAALVFGERITARRLAGVGIGFAGVAAVILQRPGAQLAAGGLGDLMIVASVVSFATGGVVVQRLARNLDTFAISWLIYVAGTLLLVLHTLLTAQLPDIGVLFPGITPWALVLYSGVLATAVGNLAWNRGIATLGIGRTGMFLYWVPIFGIAFAVACLGEPFSLWLVAGLASVLVGTWIGTQPASPATRSTKP